jgi:hypothetical protein
MPRTIPVALGAAMLTLVVGIGLACSSGSKNTGGGKTSAVDIGADATSAPASTGSNKAAATPTATSSKVPTFAKGDWTGGQAEVRMSGGDTRTVTGSILQKSSSTDGGTTRLTYVDGIETINISISTQYEPFSATAFSEKGSRISVRTPYGKPPCVVTYKETSEKRIEGSFRCEHSEIEVGANQGTPVMMEGTFTATR